jgi:hypothetical protein
MPIILSYISGRQRLVEGENWKQLDESTPRAGTVNLRSIPEGRRIIAIKSSLEEIEEIPQAVWDANIQKQKDAEEAAAAEQAKKRSDDEADKKAKAAAATLALLESKTLKGRIRKLLGRRKP